MSRSNPLYTRLLLALGVLGLVFSGSVTAWAASSNGPRPPSDLEADRLLHAAMLDRDRGDADAAIAGLQRLLKRRPDFVAGHRLYMEAAALSRRNGRLVEAEYRHFLQQEPSDPLRKLLHAAATLTRELTTPGPLNMGRLASVEEKLAFAQEQKSTRVDALLVAADLARARRDPRRIEAHIRAAYEEAPRAPSVQREQLLLFAALGDMDRAASLCLRLLKRAPWRAHSCAEVFPDRAGDPAPAEDIQEKIVAELLRQEKRGARDPVILQSLEAFYAAVEDRKGGRRIREALRGLDPDWLAPLDRDPYLAPLKEGELTDDEVNAVQRLEEITRETEEDPFQRVRALSVELDSRGLSPRVRAMFLRQKAYALRDPQVLDRDGSRSAIEAALKAQPDDPHILNEWAYMSAMDRVNLAGALNAIERAMDLLLGEHFDLRALELGEGFSEWEIDRAESVGAFVDTHGWVLYHLGRHQEAAQRLELASLLTSDGTVHGHLGRARYALGNDNGALHNLLRALALGTEEEEEVHRLALLVYEKVHIVPGGLDALVEETRQQISDEILPIFGPGELGAGSLPQRERLDLRPPRGASATKNPDHPLLGEVAPAFDYTSLDGGAVISSRFAGQVVVVDFWATWCAPCIEALPALEALAQTFDGAPVSFVALSLDEELDTVREFFSRRDVRFRVGLATEGVAEAFSVQGIPSTFVLDQRGRIVAHHQGFEPSWVTSVTADLVRLLEAGLR